MHITKFTAQTISCEAIAGYILFANHYKTWMKWKFRRKNCKFAKLDENLVIHYSSVIQSFTPESNFFSSCEKSLWVCHGKCSPGKTRRTEFCKKTFCKTLRTTFYTLFVVRINFVILSGICSGLWTVCSPLMVILETSLNKKYLDKHVRNSP